MTGPWNIVMTRILEHSDDKRHRSSMTRSWNRVMTVKMVQDLRKKRMGAQIKKMQEMLNKDLEELKKKQTELNNTITEMKNTLEGINSRATEAEE